MQEVTAERYSELVTGCIKSFKVEFNALEIGLLQGAMRLLKMHPEVKNFSPDFHVMVEKMLDFTRDCFREMGFTEEEIEYLNSE